MKRIKLWWEAHFLHLELGASLFLGIVFIFWSEFLGGKDIINNVLLGDRGEVYGALASIFGALLGFTITSVSIVLGYAESDRFEILRNSKHYQDLWNVFRAAIKALTVSTMAALLGLILDRDCNPVQLLLYLNVLTCILVFFRLGRSIWVLEKIIGIVTKR